MGFEPHYKVTGEDAHRSALRIGGRFRVKKSLPSKLSIQRSVGEKKKKLLASSQRRRRRFKKVKHFRSQGKRRGRFESASLSY